MNSDVTRRAITVPLALLALAGCAHGRCPYRSLSAFAPAAPTDTPLPVYHIACPDVLEVRLADKPNWDCLASVGVDGRVKVGPEAAVAVEGLTAEQARVAVAAVLGVDVAGVAVTVADPRAGSVDLFGPEANRHRAVAYRGPESVVEFLRRTGAMKPGCFDPRDVTVLRPNVAAGRPAEVFHVDLEAVVLRGDARTDLAVMAGDQVYVGESRRSSFARLLPARLKPVYQRLTGIGTEAP